MRGRWWVPSLSFENPLEDFFAFEKNLTKKESSGISIYEDENFIYVEAAMPGIHTEDIEISFDNGILWIRGETKKEKKDVKYHVKAASNFSYQIPIPERYDETKNPEAECINGILKITFTKAKGQKPKTIPIKRK